MHASLPDWVLDVGFSVLSQILIMATIPLIVMFLFKRRAGDNRRTLLPSFGFSKPSIKVLGWAVALGFLIFFFNIFVSGFFNGILATTGFRFPHGGGGAFAEMGVAGLFITLILVAVLPGICEEISHRGMLMNGMAPKFGVAKAVLFSSIIFGLMHLNIVQMFYAAILGYIIAWAVLATRSLWTGIIMHFINNGFGVYLSFAGSNNWLGGNLFEWLGGFNPIIFMAMLVVVYLLIVTIVHSLAKDNFERTFANHERMPEWKEQSKRRGKWGQIKLYVDPTNFGCISPSPPIISPVERTVFGGIIFLGTVVTLMTLIWGLL